VTLAKRLLAGLLVLVILLVAGVVAIAGSRLRDRLAQETRRELEREARLVASNWKPGGSAEFPYADDPSLWHVLELVR
jgi:hypothetical protein